MGMGNSVVELFSAAISVTVWRNRSEMDAGSRDMTPAACESFFDACSSPSALMTFARRSRSASAWRAMARFISWGRSMSFTSTADTSMPQASVPSSIWSRRIVLTRSRSASSSSSSACPTTLRSVVCASWLVANR